MFETQYILLWATAGVATYLAVFHFQLAVRVTTAVAWMSWSALFVGSGNLVTHSGGTTFVTDSIVVRAFCLIMALLTFFMVAGAILEKYPTEDMQDNVPTL